MFETVILAMALTLNTSALAKEPVAQDQTTAAAQDQVVHEDLGDADIYYWKK